MSVERKYANPPIVEAVCEFRLRQDVKWDPTIPGVLYGKVRDSFPIKEGKLVQDVTITQKQEGISHQIRTTERAWFLSDDRKTFAQLGPGVLAVNRLNPYPGWGFFKPRIEMAFRALRDIVPMGDLERIGLRYINRIEIPSQPINLQDYFAYGPYFGPSLREKSLAAFLVLCTIPFCEGRDACNVQLATPAPEQAAGSTFVLDMDYFLSRPRSVSEEGAMEWVETAHGNILEIFESCITDRLREIFQEVK
jgi:uncharacterized protein (TIGR04255 family)